MASFSFAVDHLKQGKKLAREGWNGKGMFVFLNNGSIAADRAKPPFIGGVQTSLFELGDVGTVTRMPNINMKAADGSTVMGWVASQVDLLAEDWQVVLD